MSYCSRLILLSLLFNALCCIMTLYITLLLDCNERFFVFTAAKPEPLAPSNYATAGSDFGDDLESLNHEPLPTSLSSRPYNSAAPGQNYNHVEAPHYTTGAPNHNTGMQNYSTSAQNYNTSAANYSAAMVSQNYGPVSSQSYPIAASQSYGSTSHQPYSVPQQKTDVYQGIGSLSLSETKQDIPVDGSYNPFNVGPSLTSTPAVARGVNGYSVFNPSAPQPNLQVGTI